MVFRLLLRAVCEPNRRRYVLTRVRTVARQLREDVPQHVHTHFAWDTATVASTVADLLPASSSITVHAKDIYTQPVRTMRRRLARFGTVMTVCNFNVGYLLGSRMIGPRGPHVQVIACGVQIPPDRAPDPVADIVAVGRLFEKKASPCSCARWPRSHTSGIG